VEYVLTKVAKRLHCIRHPVRARINRCDIVVISLFNNSFDLFFEPSDPFSKNKKPSCCWDGRFVLAKSILLQAKVIELKLPCPGLFYTLVCQVCGGYKKITPSDISSSKQHRNKMSTATPIFDHAPITCDTADIVLRLDHPEFEMADSKPEVKRISGMNEISANPNGKPHIFH